MIFKFVIFVIRLFVIALLSPRRAFGKIVLKIAFKIQNGPIILKIKENKSYIKENFQFSYQSFFFLKLLKKYTKK